MKLTIDLDESLTVGAYIEGVEKPSQRQALAMLYMAEAAGILRNDLLDLPDT